MGAKVSQARSAPDLEDAGSYRGSRIRCRNIHDVQSCQNAAYLSSAIYNEITQNVIHIGAMELGCISRADVDTHRTVEFMITRNVHEAYKNEFYLTFCGTHIEANPGILTSVVSAKPMPLFPSAHFPSDTGESQQSAAAVPTVVNTSDWSALFWLCLGIVVSFVLARALYFLEGGVWQKLQSLLVALVLLYVLCVWSGNTSQAGQTAQASNEEEAAAEKVVIPKEAKEEKVEISAHTGLTCMLLHDTNNYRHIQSKIEEFMQFVPAGENMKLNIAGHSAGGALAIIFAAICIRTGFFEKHHISATVWGFGTPGVISLRGSVLQVSESSRALLAELSGMTHCFVNQYDVFTRLLLSRRWFNSAVEVSFEMVKETIDLFLTHSSWIESKLSRRVDRNRSNFFYRWATNAAMHVTGNGDVDLEEVQQKLSECIESVKKWDLKQFLPKWKNWFQEIWFKNNEFDTYKAVGMFYIMLSADNIVRVRADAEYISILDVIPRDWSFTKLKEAFSCHEMETYKEMLLVGGSAE